MKLRAYILSLLAVGMALVLLFHFGGIWVFGEFFIVEPDTMMLSIETATMVGILLFSLFCLFEQLRGIREPEKPAGERTHKR